MWERKLRKECMAEERYYTVEVICRMSKTSALGCFAEFLSYAAVGTLFLLFD